MTELSAKDKVFIAMQFMKDFRKDDKMQKMSDAELDNLYALYELSYFITKFMKEVPSNGKERTTQESQDASK